jgi:AcrR family transcriptional regulator
MARRGHHTLEQIKNMVLVAAEELVIQGGLSQLRVRNIAAKIGYTVGSIYMVFSNMDDLILHVKARSLDEIAEMMDQVQAPNAEQRLEELAGVYIRYASQNFNRWSLVFEHRLPEGCEVPSWYQKKLDNVYGKFEAQFSIIAPDLTSNQCRQTALAFLGGIHGICSLLLTTQLAGLNDNDLEESVILLIRRFIHDGWMNAMSEMTSSKNASANTWRLWPTASPVYY